MNPTKPVEREATKQANDLLRRLNREVFIDSIDIYRLPHAVGIVMDFAQASASAALERAAQIAENAQTFRVRSQTVAENIAVEIRALKGSR